MTTKTIKIADIDLDRQADAALGLDLVRDLGRTDVIAIGDDDFGASRCKAERQCPANIAPSPGDDGDPANDAGAGGNRPSRTRGGAQLGG